jgi:uncharacterized protein YjbI with pentapeptide repeats
MLTQRDVPKTDSRKSILALVLKMPHTFSRTEERQVDDQQQSRWRPTRRQLLWAGAAVALLTIAILIGYRYGITLWDWVKLLVVPAVIAAAGLWYNRQQRDREIQIARQRAQDEALQAYFDQMSDLMLNHALRKSKANDEIRTVARARTLTVLEQLDASRKTSVVRFLGEAGLIQKEVKEEDVNEEHVTSRPVISLNGADLRGADLSSSLYLRGADLFRANLHGVYLSWLYVFGAYRRGVRLSVSDMREVDLREVEWKSGERRLVMPILDDAILREADLSEANLRGAHLDDAHLDDAILSGADLSMAIITQEQLDRIMSLKGATMPNGQKYEEWIKDKEGREEDE